MRVVSLLPSATEICFALGVEPVGVSHECDHPPEARGLPSVNEVRIDETGSSAEINEQVADAAAGEGVYRIDRDRLEALDPDLVITQGVCDVCAVDRVRVRDAVDDLGLDADVLTLDVHSLDDLFRAIEAVGAACGRTAHAESLIDDLEARVEAVETRASTSGGAHEARPRVAVLDWLDPVMVAGHWVPEMVEIAGGRYDLEDAGSHSRPREWSEVRGYDPEVLVLSPCGFELPQIETNLEEITSRPGWESLAAVKNGRVYLIDGHHYVNRAGPRLVDTLEYLAATVQPKRFSTPPQEVARRLDPATV